ncbi:MAG: hypothetical protein JXB35_10715 [Anaerolineae bacterium]|nr:hypothetical protein [Anaerolineae bacterium]
MTGDKIQHADWKSEKHVPVIECADAVASGALFEVTVSCILQHPWAVGK